MCVFAWSAEQEKKISIPGMIVDPARGQLNRENSFLPSLFALKKMVWRAIPCRVKKTCSRLCLYQAQYSCSVIIVRSALSAEYGTNGCIVTSPARGQLNREIYFFPVPVRA